MAGWMVYNCFSIVVVDVVAVAVAVAVAVSVTVVVAVAVAVALAVAVVVAVVVVASVDNSFQIVPNVSFDAVTFCYFSVGSPYVRVLSLNQHNMASVLHPENTNKM